MLLKLDIQKEYDKVDWRFLCKTLESFGFSNQWINIIFQCISTPKISLLINGTPEGFLVYLGDFDKVILSLPFYSSSWKKKSEINQFSTTAKKN